MLVNIFIKLVQQIRGVKLKQNGSVGNNENKKDMG